MKLKVISKKLDKVSLASMFNEYSGDNLAKEFS